MGGQNMICFSTKAVFGKLVFVDVVRMFQEIR